MSRDTALAWLRRNGPVVIVEGAINIAAPALIYAMLQDRWGEVPALLRMHACILRLPFR